MTLTINTKLIETRAGQEVIGCVSLDKLGLFTIRYIREFGSQQPNGSIRARSNLNVCG